MFAKISRGALVLLAILVFCMPALAASEPKDFNLPSLDGGYLKLSDFKGRVVVIDFFATWCRPCKESIPYLDDLAKRYRDQGLSVIGFDIDEPWEKVKPFIARMGVRFPVVLGSLAEARKLAPVKGLPSTVIIDPQGRVVQHFVGKAPVPLILTVASPYLNKKAPPPPSAAKIKRREQGDKRFGRVWVMNSDKIGDMPGVSLYVEADIADLWVEQGLWLELNLQAEVRNVSGSLFPVNKPKQLYKRIDNSLQEGFKLFISCDQMPYTPEQGVYRAWFTLLDARRQTLEKSAEILLSGGPCRVSR